MDQFLCMTTTKMGEKESEKVVNRIIAKLFLGVALLSAFMVASTSLYAAAPEGKSKRPNILLIIGDDIGIDMSSDMYPGLIDSLTKQYGPKGHNHKNYKMIDGKPSSTPVLDSLAQGGMRFTQAWAQPFCSPTRTSLLSGLYSAKTGVLDYFGALSKNHHSFVNDLKEKGGYSTAVFGKWHIAGLGQFNGMMPKEAGFDVYKGNLSGGVQTYWDYAYHIQDAETPADKYRTEKPPKVSLPGIAPTTFAPVVKTYNTINWIKEQEAKDPDKPWFAYLAFNLSHITGKMQPSAMVIPNKDTLDEKTIKEMEACAGSQGQFGSANRGSCSDGALMRAMTNTLDTMVGKVIETIDNLDPNTYIIYIGDNGTWVFAGMNFIDNMYITKEGRSKGTAYESGVRVSMAIRGPGIKAGSESNEWVHTTDLFSTILELAGLDVPKTVPNKEGNGMVEVDSVSLKPILLDGAKSVRDPDNGYILAETINPTKNNLMHVAARNETYKLICSNSAATESCEFYNLKDDPLEEYPLEKPSSNKKFKDGTWTPKDQEWHFCHLQEVIAEKSFLANPPPPRRPMFGAPKRKVQN